MDNIVYEGGKIFKESTQVTTDLHENADESTSRDASCPLSMHRTVLQFLDEDTQIFSTHYPFSLGTGTQLERMGEIAPFSPMGTD